MCDPSADPARSGTLGADGSGDPLGGARDRGGRSPRSWLEASLRGTGEPLIALRSGAGSLRVPVACTDLLRVAGTDLLRVAVAGTDLLAGPSSYVLADHRRLPLDSKSVPAIALEMCLPALDGLDDLFGEVRRVLRPAGTVAALVPARPTLLTGLTGLTGRRTWRSLERAFGARPRFRNESTRDNLHWIFAAADFAVLADRRRTFRLPVPDEAAAADAVDTLVRGAIWPPDVRADQLERARSALIEYAAPGRSLPLALRLLVARR